MDDRAHDILDQAVDSWRSEGGDEHFSPHVRSSLFDQVRTMGPGVLATAKIAGFARAWRLALLGAIPVVVISAVLVAGGRHATAPSGSGLLTAVKVDGQVVFTLANGNQPHTVYASTDPQKFDRTEGVPMAQDRFQVDATGGPDLVFYRVD